MDEKTTWQFLGILVFMTTICYLSLRTYLARPKHKSIQSFAQAHHLREVDKKSTEWHRYNERRKVYSNRSRFSWFTFGMTNVYSGEIDGIPIVIYHARASRFFLFSNGRTVYSQDVIEYELPQNQLRPLPFGEAHIWCDFETDQIFISYDSGEQLEIGTITDYQIHRLFKKYDLQKPNTWKKDFSFKTYHIKLVDGRLVMGSRLYNYFLDSSVKTEVLEDFLKIMNFTHTLLTTNKQ